MKELLFTKFFGTRPIDEIGEKAAELEFDGLDLLIRPGTTISYEDAPRLRDAVSQLTKHGLTVPMATTDFNDPEDKATQDVLAACADAGITTVRLGYWRYEGDRPYQEILDGAQRDLDGLVDLATRHGVKLALQFHGGTIHSSGAQARVLLEGRDPEVLGAYPDPGNQAVQGGREDWRFTLDVMEPWLSCVGVKNGGWFPSGLDTSGQRIWRSDWMALSEGMVPWHEISAHLRDSDFDGFLTFHSHYEVPYEQVLDQTRNDLRFIRGITEGRSV